MRSGSLLQLLWLAGVAALLASTPARGQANLGSPPTAEELLAAVQDPSRPPQQVVDFVASAGPLVPVSTSREMFEAMAAPPDGSNVTALLLTRELPGVREVTKQPCPVTGCLTPQLRMPETPAGKDQVLGARGTSFLRCGL